MRDMNLHSQRPRGSWALVPGLVAIALLAFQGEAFSQQGTDDAVTFTRDIAPLLQENCQECHQPGQIAPMSLMTYEEVRPWAPMIREKVVTQEMPPYHYDTNIGIQDLIEDKRLSESEISTIAAWVDNGAPQGDPADMPPPVEWPDASEWLFAAQFGQPDLVVPGEPAP